MDKVVVQTYRDELLTCDIAGNKGLFTTRNLAFCNCLMQLVSSCMRHMQLEIHPVANDKLHEICSCM
jgi:hypothetical protein